MADVPFNSNVQPYKEKLLDMGDGTHAKRMVQVGPDGTAKQVLAPGRANAAASAPVALSNEDKAALDAAKSGYNNVVGQYTNNSARSAGTGILCLISAGGTATLTFGGVDIVFTFVIGPAILPLAITKTVLGTAAGTFYAIS